jgi:membrane protease YdiL (CAAX protease family)
MHHDPDQPQDHSAPTRSPDPGSGFSRALTLFIAIMAAALVIGWQNLSEDQQYATFGATPPEIVAPTPDAPAPGRFGQTDLVARVFLRMRSYVHNQGAAGDEIDEAVVENMHAAAFSPEDKVRAAIMIGEFRNVDEAVEFIQTARAQITESEIDRDEGGGPYSDEYPLVRAELNALESIYRYGRDSVSIEMKAQLEARYGPLGRAAITHGLPDTDPEREPVVTGFLGITIFLLVVAAVVILAPLVGLVILTLGLIKLGSSRTRVLRFYPPAPGGSVFLESYALFVIGFGIMSVGATALAALVDPAWALVSMPMQWGLMLTPLWPLVRGMRSSEWRRAIGLHRGAGVFKEIGVGFLAYLACIPIYFVAVAITFVIIIIVSSAKNQSTIETTPSNPIFDLVSSGDLFTIVMLYALATIWAPITEELIFRGALHRHLRARLHWVFTGLASAVLFAFMHSYGPMLVVPLITLGFVFAFVREWRGSIIAPMTMHFIHNFTLVTMLVVLVLLLRDPI